jgi:hypothetical protein
MRAGYGTYGCRPETGAAGLKVILKRLRGMAMKAGAEG